QLGNTVNYGGSASGSNVNIKVLDANHAVFKTPKSITIPVSQLLTLFTANATFQGFHAAALPVANVLFISQDPVSPTYYPISYENNKYGIFGYYGSPVDMTQAGKDFLVNLVYFTGKF
ncbi:MAG TPA: hypothetical protein VGO58_10685, partial [Chitinophagaceae bacterium]|nr:hypothetical protein [Chitinophagaceae bacterium]